MITNYDKIAQGYKNAIGTCLRENVHDYNFEKIIPTYLKKNKIIPQKSSVLDLACGEGRYTRLLKELGFSKVIGCDVSVSLIDMAKNIENQNPKEINYYIADCANLEKYDLGEFDLITAWFLLHYAKSKSDLDNFFLSIAQKLKKGGVFIGYQSNPYGPQSKNFTKYGEIKKVIGEEVEGADVNVTLITDNNRVEFIRKYWKPESYIESLKKAGLKFECWIPAEINPKSLKILGNDFWKEYQINPSHTAIIATKL